MKQVDFDRFSGDYDDILGAHLHSFEPNSDYFAEYKIRLTRQLVTAEPATILDFGCGTGRSIEHFRRWFPGSSVVGVDVSEGSLTRARRTHADVQFFEPRTLPPRPFDLVFAAGVFHHIAPAHRRSTMLLCAERLLSARGQLVIFEHNPYNPVTRHLVRTCPFDRDAQLISRRRLVALIRSAGLVLRQSRYTLFFPGPLSWMRPLERHLASIPLGGQYVVHACRQPRAEEQDELRDP